VKAFETLKIAGSLLVRDFLHLVGEFDVSPVIGLEGFFNGDPRILQEQFDFAFV
jgi:hypothetical protein